MSRTRPHSTASEARSRHHARNWAMPEPVVRHGLVALGVDIIGYMSTVFDEARLASTFAQAEDILWTNGPTTTAEQFDKNLLTAWLNFADGTIEYDMMLDLDKDGTPETTFLAAVAAAEAVRLDPTSTEDELQAQKNFLGSLH
jgi:hypothetical protein